MPAVCVFPCNLNSCLGSNTAQNSLGVKLGHDVDDWVSINQTKSSWL
jgi:hypothetical protein